ncbi:ABC transporter ATP-binding protein [uncultured Senegalimassilia sp.]|uniref:ABC transporter ATP-binding protein n=1 Tax=uncultured Senegalimassilia sp. TaxID=1714350 RepID=UPI00267496E2|nr:ABC transporter ATP-binding protein [uncultured Senegalimassilia sp.]
MTEIVNTSPLASHTDQSSVVDTRPVMIDVDHVSMVFNMASEQLNSLKEYAVAFAKRELMFKEFRAIDDVSFTVRKGDVFGILGTNGSGKSTMLKIIAGVLEPSSGSCHVNGNIAPLIELGAGFDFELTARENIYLNGALLGYSRKFINQHFDEIVEFAEIEKFLDMPMKNYSSGMVARIAFAIATVIVPDVLIVDEVLSVGDFMFQQKCEQRIMSLIKEHDVTVLIVSHNNDQIERLCNKAIWIEKGHARMMGSASEVCDAYRALGGHIGSAESEAIVYDTLVSPVPVDDQIATTIAGDDRYGTAVKLSALCERPSCDAVVLSVAELPSICFSAAALAAAYDAPLLLIKPDHIPDSTMQELQRLKPSTIIVAGVASERESSILAELQQHFNDVHIRFAQSTEPQTAALDIYRSAEPQQWGDCAIVSWDGCFGDQMSLLPYSTLKKAPYFYIDENDQIDNETWGVLTSGHFSSVLFLGSDRTFPDEMLTRLHNSGVIGTRICEDNASLANKRINADYIIPTLQQQGKNVRSLIVSSTWQPFNSFNIGGYAIENDAAMLLVDSTNLDSMAFAIQYLKELNGDINRLVFVGDDNQFNRIDKRLLIKAAMQTAPKDNN